MRVRWLAIGIAAALLVAVCSSSDDKAAAPVGSTTSSLAGSTKNTVAVERLRVLVTNDDGVGAPGIDVLVEALRKVPDTDITVVAPVKNQSGTGGKVTAGAPAVGQEAKTGARIRGALGGGIPRPTRSVWALDQNGIASSVPHVVLSGINVGQTSACSSTSPARSEPRWPRPRGIPAVGPSARGSPTGRTTTTTVKASARVARTTPRRAARETRRRPRPLPSRTSTRRPARRGRRAPAACDHAGCGTRRQALRPGRLRHRVRVTDLRRSNTSSRHRRSPIAGRAAAFHRDREAVYGAGGQPRRGWARWRLRAQPAPAGAPL